MKAKKIWIATHPEDDKAIEVSIYDCEGVHTHVFSPKTQTEEYVPYKEYVIFEVEN